MRISECGVRNAMRNAESECGARHEPIVSRQSVLVIAPIALTTVLDDADVRNALVGKRLPDLGRTLRWEDPHRHHRETVVGKDLE